MTRKLILSAVITLLMAGLATAQYCPTPSRSITNNSQYIQSNIYSTLDMYAFNFSNILEQGLRSGALTRHEVFSLENDFDRIMDRVRMAYYDGKMTRSEWSMIEFKIRNLERDLKRELNDEQRKLS
jgi:hypothetical protein